MYINVTIDLNKYDQKPMELRLSDHYSVKSLVDIVWQTRKIKKMPREGYWVKNLSKNKMSTGNMTLKDSNITTGDRIKIL